MDELWFTGCADELARCLLDCERCADACETLLERAAQGSDPELQKNVVGAVVGPAAVARVLIELIDHPPHLVLAACRLCRETADAAVRQLEALGTAFDAAEAVAALRSCSSSCSSLLDAASPA